MAKIDIGAYEYGTVVVPPPPPPPLPIPEATLLIRQAVDLLQGSAVTLVAILGVEVENWRKAHK